MKRTLAWTTVAGGLATLAAATALAAAGVSPFPTWYYHFAWYSTLAAADAGLTLADRDHSWPGGVRFRLSLWLWSVPLWLLFELANLRLANWYYVMAEPDLWLRRTGTVLAFATVLPALFLAERWLRRLRLGSRVRTRPLTWPARHPGALLAAGCAFAALSLLAPRFFFPLIWGALTLLLEPYNLRHGGRGSLVADLAEGRPGRLFRLLAAGALIGVLWESFNSIAQTRWIYTVPWLEGWKLFEMPIPGYLGFPVLAVDGFVAYRALANAGVAVPGWGAAGEREGDRPIASATAEGPARRGLSRPRTALAALVASAVSLAVMSGMDRWTIDSYHPRLSELPGAGAAQVSALARAGYERVERLSQADPDELAAVAAVPSELAGRWVRLSRLAFLRGIGLTNALALEDRGYGSACDLVEAEPAAVEEAVRGRRSDPRAGFAPRVRVWIRSAREACGSARARRAMAPARGADQTRKRIESDIWTSSDGWVMTDPGRWRGLRGPWNGTALK